MKVKYTKNIKNIDKDTTAVIGETYKVVVDQDGYVECDVHGEQLTFWRGEYEIVENWGVDIDV